MERRRGVRVGLREDGGSTTFNGSKPICLDAQAQGDASLSREFEGPTNLLSFGQGRVVL